MKTFFDSSAFAKRFMEENGSDRVDEICGQTTILAISILCVPEIISAFNRRLREQGINQEQYFSAKSDLLIEIQDAVIINLTPAIINQATILLENNQLRAMDALHIACAIEWEAELFVSSDQQQIRAAKNSGLNTIIISS